MQEAVAPSRATAVVNALARWRVTIAHSGPPLLFGVRLWAAVCLALYVAFRLELDEPFWAGTSAAIMCQPHLGASLRKGWFRMIGTIVGAVATVVLVTLFPQDRTGFLIGVALWGGASALVATSLKNFAAYAAALAGYTMAIIAGDELGATGGANRDVFMLAVMRVSEICIGIASAGIVLAGTELGSAPRRLAAVFANVSSDIARRFGSMLSGVASAPADVPLALRDLEQQPAGRDLVRQVAGLDPLIDETIGESAVIRNHQPVLYATTGGLFAALAGWRTVAARLARLPDDEARRLARAVLGHLPQHQCNATTWIADPLKLRSICDAAMRTLGTMRTHTPSLRLLADQTAKAVAGTMRALDALALLVNGQGRSRSPVHAIRHRVPDWLPCVVNGARAMVTIGAVELFWIVTAWPSGASAITFAAITVILLSPWADEAYPRALGFTIGVGIAAVCAAVAAFAALPNVQTFAGFGFVMALFLIPLGALMAQPWQQATFAAMAGNFIPVLGPTNPMSYDTVQFYNSAVAIVAGCGVAALSFRLFPPLSAAVRTRRLLALTLRDLRRVAIDPVQRLRNDWEERTVSRLAAMPDRADPIQRGHLLMALSVGTEIVHLRRAAPRLGINTDLDAALQALAKGKSGCAKERLVAVDRRLALLPERDPQASLALQTRSGILVICDALTAHRDYLHDGGAA